MLTDVSNGKHVEQNALENIQVGSVDEAGVTECQDHAFGFSTSGVKVGSPKGATFGEF